MTEVLAYTYTSQAEIERVYSKKGTTRRTDIDNTGASDPQIIQQVIDIATDEINMYLEPYYSTLDMSNNLWIRRQATYIACHYLSSLRGHATQYNSYYTRIKEWLERINEGKLQVPRLYRKSNMTPAVSNYIVDNRYRINNVRVLADASTGGVSSDQDLAEYLIPDFPY